MTGPVTVWELRSLFLKREYCVEDTHGKGIFVALPNDWSISVQWGNGNYCSNMDLESPWIRLLDEKPAHWKDSPNAEIQVYDEDDRAVRFEGWTEDLKGWVLIPEILSLVDYLVEGTLSEPTDKATVDGASPKF